MHAIKKRMAEISPYSLALCSASFMPFISPVPIMPF